MIVEVSLDVDIGQPLLLLSIPGFGIRIFFILRAVVGVVKMLLVVFDVNLGDAVVKRVEVDGLFEDQDYLIRIHKRKCVSRLRVGCLLVAGLSELLVRLFSRILLYFLYSRVLFCFDSIDHILKGLVIVKSKLEEVCSLLLLSTH